MKKRNIISLLLAIALLFIEIGSVEAGCIGSNTVRSNGSTLGAPADYLAFSGMCKHGIYDSIHNVNAVRISVVDAAGNRVAGTVSADFSNDMVGGSNFQPSMVGWNLYYASVGTKKTRNEIVTSGGNGNLDYQAGASSSVYYWANLPTNDGNTLNAFFTTQFATTYQADMVQIFAILNYTGYTDPNVYRNHYLLVEPIFKVMVRIGDEGTISDSCKNCDHYKNAIAQTECKKAMCPVKDDYYFCKYTSRYYYGTATEIFSMMKQNDDDMLKRGSAQVFGYNFGMRVHANSSVAGLIDASDTSKSNVLSRLISSYGVGAMHVWMEHINCPTCTPICPDGTPMPENGVCATCPDGTPMPPDGTCSSDLPDACDYSLLKYISNDCTDDQAGQVSDTSNWACIFKTKTAAQNTYEGNFYHVNGVDLSTNRYCSVACREDIYYSFSSPFTIDAGTRFTIGGTSSDMFVLDPGRMIGNSECRTAPKDSTEAADAKINYELFAQEYAEANRRVAEAWDEYLRRLTDEEALASADAAGQTNYTTGDEPCDPSSHEVANPDYAAEKYHYDMCIALGYIGCGSGPSETITVDYDWPACDEGFRHGGGSTYEEWDQVGNEKCRLLTLSGKYCKQIEYHKSNDGQHGDNRPNLPSSTEALRTYEILLGYRDGLLNQIKECNNFIRNYNDFSPELTFSYDDPTYGNSFQLQRNSSTTISDTKYYRNDSGETGKADWLAGDSTANVYGSGAEIMSYLCDTYGQACKRSTVIYPTNDYVLQTVQKTYTYNLPADMYRYMGKNGLQSSSSTTYSNIEYSEAYRDFGRELLPVSYNYSYCKTTNKYMYSFYFGYSGEKVLFGRDSKFTRFSDTIGLESGGITVFRGVQTSDNIDYRCYFEVDQDFKKCKEGTCDESNPNWNSSTRTCDGGGSGDGGINIIYRPISLDNPFPGEHGLTKNPSGRTPGSNWNWSFTNKSGSTESAVHAYITENRGVHTEQVYGQTPIYEFILDPTNIRRIRKYNSEQKHNYTDFETLECYGNTAEFCKSTFLQNGESNGYFQFTSDNPTGGTCFGKGGTTDEEWNACRYGH